jgi:hypothetical protein
VFAHRFAWETFVGPIPEGLVIDHVLAAGCTHRNCVNPDHLEPVTQLENMWRGLHTQKTHCANGHPRTTENTIYRRDGSRRCRRCYAEAREAKRDGLKPRTSYHRDVPEKTHCKQGHPFAGENLLISSGKKYCRICIRDNKARSRARLAGRKVA